jgi:Mg-chelatase subunit ChlD
MSDLSLSRRRTRRAFYASACLFALTALLCKKWMSQSNGPEIRSMDLLICLDVSRSMLAKDLAPNRLQAAKNSIRALTEFARADRFALVSFAGEARLSIPLTHDAASFAQLVELAGPDSVGRGGSDLGAALKTAKTALHGRTGVGAVVLLLTDGENLQPGAVEMAEQFGTAGIRLHTIGFGSELGSKIALYASEGQAFLRDADGLEVISKMRRSSLERLAQLTGGQFIDANSGQDCLVRLYQRAILPMVTGGPNREGQPVVRLASWWWLLAAFFTWLLALSLSDRRTP